MRKPILEFKRLSAKKLLYYCWQTTPKSMHVAFSDAVSRGLVYKVFAVNFITHLETYLLIA